MITSHEIALLVGDVNYSKGVYLFEQNRVQSVALGCDKLNGRVYDIYFENVYHQSIDLSPLKGDFKFYLIGFCTCMESYNCEHVAAVLLNVKNRLVLSENRLAFNLLPESSQPPENLESDAGFSHPDSIEPDHIQTWLNQLFAEELEPAKKTRAKESRETLLYVIDFDRSGRPTVLAYRARSRFRGAPTFTNKQFQPNKVFDFDAFLSVEDISILAKMAYWQDPASPTDYIWPDDETLANFLQEVAATGRARTSKKQGRTLAWGPPIEVNVRQEKFQKNKRYVKSLGSAKKVSRFVQLLQFPKWIYVDDKKGLIGEVEVFSSELRTKIDTTADLNFEDGPTYPFETLHYVVENEFDPAIVPYVVRMNQGKPPKVRMLDYEWYLDSLQKQYLTADEISMLAKLNLSTKSQSRTYPLADDAWVEFFQDIAMTGRLRYAEPLGLPLRWGSPEKGRIEWGFDHRGYQKVQIAIEANDNEDQFIVFSFPELIYINTKSGIIGTVYLDMPKNLVFTMMEALTLSPFQVEPVALQLAKFESFQLPLPLIFSSMPTEIEILPEPIVTFFSRSFVCSTPSRDRFDSRDEFAEKEIVIVPCARLEFKYEGAAKPVILEEGRFALTYNEHGPSLILRAIRRELNLEAQLMNFGYAYQLMHIYDAELDYSLKPYDADDFEESDFLFNPIYQNNDSISNSPISFIRELVPRLKNAGWQFEFEDSWPYRFFDEKLSFSSNAEFTGNDWFTFSFDVEVAGTKINIIPVIERIILNLPYYKIENPEVEFDFEEYLHDKFYLLQMTSKSSFGIVRIPGRQIAPFVEAFFDAYGLNAFHQAEAGRVAALVDALDDVGAPWVGGKSLISLGKKLEALVVQPEVDQPVHLQGTLRSYQKIGFGWLRSLGETEFGGILADDMGLGKTVQALALLVHRHIELKSDRPSLLIAPTTLLSNWIREAARFAPELKLLRLQGPKRKKRFCEISDHHLILSTYPLVNRDYGELFSHTYELAILDEAQHVKNPAAKVSRRIRLVKARQRIALTGTPVENNLEELWSLCDWLIPGLLGDRKSFKNKYRIPIEREGDQFVQRNLNARLKPFLLRRTKEEVALELPPKTEINELVPLSSNQAALYESIRLNMDQRIRKAITEKGMERSRITILDALLKLRQVCCDPALVKIKSAKKFKTSAKRQRLMELLESLVSEGRSVLVFSQFVTMLRLIENDVKSRNWKYSMLHGQTKERDQQIDRFQDGDTQIFLISLKAGGLGLNLTAADTVIIYDPWWNPAVERQAMDRAHRIGQDKPVFVYRLIAEGTVETAIQELQIRKQALADALFEGREKGVMTLTEEDIDNLLAPIS